VSARLQAVLGAEESFGVSVQGVHQLDAQLIEGHVADVVEPGDHRDGAHHLAADTEPRAYMSPASAGGGRLMPSRAASAVATRECSPSSNGACLTCCRSRSRPAQATSGQLTMVSAMAGLASASRTKLLPTTCGPNNAAQARLAKTMVHRASRTIAGVEPADRQIDADVELAGHVVVAAHRQRGADQLSGACGDSRAVTWRMSAISLSGPGGGGWGRESSARAKPIP